MAADWQRVLWLILCTTLWVAQSTHAGQGLWQLTDEFVDEYGTRAPLSHWAAEQTIVSMEYSDCKFVCTVNWRRLVEIQEEADRLKIDIRVLVVSLDPAHDTPEAWRDYRSVRGLKRKNWNFVTGTRKGTDSVVALLGVKWWYFNDAIMHDFRVTRFNAAGRRMSVMDKFDESASAFLVQ